MAGYLKILDERYRMIERRQPIFAKLTGRSGRFYIRDNFLRSWLGALAVPVASAAFRPVAGLVGLADARLAETEGYGLERLTMTLYEERSRGGIGDFALSAAVRGWWDRRDTEIDLVALDEEQRVVRLGTCKRSPDRLVADLGRFDGHVGRFLAGMPRFRGWRVERVAVAPLLLKEHRSAIQAAGVLPQDLGDLTAGLGPHR